MTIQTSTGRLISIAPISRPGFPALSNSVIRLPRAIAPKAIAPLPIQPTPQSLLPTAAGPMSTKPITIITKDACGKETPVTFFSAPHQISRPGIGDGVGQNEKELVLNYDSSSGKISVIFTSFDIFFQWQPLSLSSLVCIQSKDVKIL